MSKGDSVVQQPYGALVCWRQRLKSCKRCSSEAGSGPMQAGAGAPTPAMSGATQPARAVYRHLLVLLSAVQRLIAAESSWVSRERTSCSLPAAGAGAGTSKTRSRFFPQ